MKIDEKVAEGWRRRAAKAVKRAKAAEAERDALADEVDRLTAEVKQWKTDLAQALETLTDIGAEQRMAEFERLKKACGG